MATVEDLSPSVSPDSSWDLSSLPEAVDPPSTDDTRIVNPPANVCPTCGEEIVREPGTRGRLPKYHPECRPSRKGTSTGTRVVRVSKADQEKAAEVETALDAIASGLFKAVVLLSLVDSYDAFVIHINTPELLSNLRVLLERYDKFRQLFLGVRTGGSIVGLVFTLACMLLPIAAHHKLVPSRLVAQFLINLPMLMLRMQALQDNSENLTEALMRRIGEQAKDAKEAEMRRQTAEDTPDAVNEV